MSARPCPVQVFYPAAPVAELVGFALAGHRDSGGDRKNDRLPRWGDVGLRTAGQKLHQTDFAVDGAFQSLPTANLQTV